MKQYPLDKTFIVATWFEALVYGFFLCLFCASLHFNLTLRKRQDNHSKVMFGVSILMFFIASFHVAMNCFRMIRGYVDHANTPGGAVAYLGNLAPWDHILKDTLYATQEILGNAASVYRCYILWGRNWKIIVLPTMLLIVMFISGYTVCGLYTSVTDTVFDPRLLRWITTFYSVAVVSNVITTGLMAYRIWDADRHSVGYRSSKGNLMPVLRILVESAFLQLFVEILLLSLYAVNYNAQYILLEIVTPLVGITFNAITIRIALRAGHVPGSQTATSVTAGRSEPHSHVETIGSVPMRRIAINITKDVQDDFDGYGHEGVNKHEAPGYRETPSYR